MALCLAEDIAAFEEQKLQQSNSIIAIQKFVSCIRFRTYKWMMPILIGTGSAKFNSVTKPVTKISFQKSHYTLCRKQHVQTRVRLIPCSYHCRTSAGKLALNTNKI